MVGPYWTRADAEKQWPFRPEVFQLVVCFRFLWRPLFPVLAAALAPGGALLYQTFTREQVRHGKPARADFLLESGELRASFERLGLRTVRYREEDPEGGPALASLWAVREGA
jgi:SAM-dependent methyltransferase